MKHSSHLRTLGKCRKHSPAARAFYISLVFSNACRVLSQCKTRLRLLYLLNKSAFWYLFSYLRQPDQWFHEKHCWSLSQTLLSQIPGLWSLIRYTLLRPCNRAKRLTQSDFALRLNATDVHAQCLIFGEIYTGSRISGSRIDLLKPAP